MHVKGAFMSNDPISTDETQITLTLPERVGMEQIVGPSDCVLREVERAFSARITVRGDTIAPRKCKASRLCSAISLKWPPREAT